MRKAAFAFALRWALAGWALVGCASTPAPARDVAHKPGDEPGSGLVWFVDRAGRHRTSWVSLHDGRSLSSLPIEGPVWAEGSMLWQWTEEPIPVPLIDCASPASPPAIIGTAVAYRVVLRELTQSLSLEMRGLPRVEPVSALSHRIAPIGSVGSLVFAKETLSYEKCGWGETLEARPLVWDLATGGAADLVRGAQHRRLVRRARAKLRSAGVDAASELALAALAPRWDALGGLTLEYVFVPERCAGCGAARVPTSPLPSELVDAARVPPWVRRALASVEGATLMGFSRIDHPAQLRVLDALRR